MTQLQTENTKSNNKLLPQLGIDAINFGASHGKNSWATTNNQGQIDSINPSNGQTISSVYNCSQQDYEYIVTKAQRAFATWRMVPAPKRGEIIRQIGMQLREVKAELGSLVALEMGKSKQEGDGEVQEMIDMADFAVGQARMLYGNTMHSERPLHRMYEQWHPLGVVGVISAFNFPVAVWAWNAFIAAICGNTVIWKPSPQTPLCTLAVQHICNQVMHANNLKSIFSCFITDDNKLAQQFVDDQRIALMSFTGSSTIGQQVATQVSQRMGRSLLECSGNNALIVDETAELELAIPAIVFGAIGTAGQRCTTTRRLFLHESIADKVKQSLMDAYRSVRIGDPLNPQNLMGPLINQDAINHFNQAIDSVKTNGGEILFGGRTIDQPGFYVEPTLVTALNHWDIVQQETFAPILYVMTYSNFDEAIAQQNDVSQGLSSALFTQSIQHAEQFLSSQGSDCGLANINIGTSGAEIGGAFGGEKATGGGREAGSDAWKSYMRRQTNTINWSREMPLAQGINFNLKS